MEKLLAFDMEPFITGEYLLTLAERHGKGPRVREIMMMGLEGKIKFADGLKLRINELRGLVEEKAAKALAEELVEDIKPEVKQIFADAKTLGYTTAVLTGSFDLVADKVKDMFGVDYVYSNRLVFKDGKLDDVVINVFENKGQLVKELREKLGIQKENTIAVFDGWPDMGMAKEGHSVGFSPAKGVDLFVDLVIKDRAELLNIINEPEAYFKGIENMLFIPGPVDVAEEISIAQTKPMISHRSNEYREMHKDIVQKLRKFFNCDDVFILTASGTGSVEAMLANMLSKDDKLLAFVNGAFGERLAENAKLFCNNVVEYKLEAGKGISLDKAKAAIEANKPTVIAIVHNETSTGVVNDVEDICKYAKGKGIYTMVDAVSSFAGHELNIKDWGIDICVTASQKCIGAPPGLSFVAVMNSAMEKIQKNDVRLHYFDLRTFKVSNFRNETPVTPAVSLIFATKVALGLLFKEGLEQRIERHREAGEILRKKLVECGFELLAEKGFESNTVTTFKTNDADFISTRLKDKFGIEVASGIDELRGKILRIGHLGNYSLRQIEKIGNAIENVAGELKRK
jgi:HAD superfamily phosphoserine phosphatase-like hydrolase